MSVRWLKCLWNFCSRETISMFCHVQRGVKEGVGEEVETEISYAFKTQNHHLKPLPLFALNQSPSKEMQH